MEYQGDFQATETTDEGVAKAKLVGECQLCIYREKTVRAIEALADWRLYEISCASPDKMNIVLNSASSVLFNEIAGRVSLGEGALDMAVYGANSMLVLNPDTLSSQEMALAESALAARDILYVKEELLAEEHI